LGRHSKPSRIRLPHGAPTVAAPTLAGVVAAFFLSQQVPVAAAAEATAPHSAALDAASQSGLSGLSMAQLASASRRAMLTAMQQAWQEKPAKSQSSLPTWYTVQPGDSLSAIAGRFYHNPDAWPVLYWHNHGQILWADSIDVGQVLRIPAEPAQIPAPPALLAPPAPRTTAVYTPRHANTTPTVAQSAQPQSAQPQPAPAQSVQTTSVDLGDIPGGAFGQCVVERESGGNPQVMNSTGHYGLFQFSESTWVEYGGNPADFGNASVAEQIQVFANALAQGGEFNWAPYDGC
jgi:LysM repeat protein